MRIAFITLGCKINQYETDVMREEIASSGNTIVPFGEEADIYIINTCTVTAKSDYQCRQMIRAAGRRNKNARVLVTGCYAEIRPQELKSLPNVLRVFGNREKQSIPDYLATLSEQSDPVMEQCRDGLAAKALRGRTRGFLKIQEGCNNRCSYCIVPFARGNSRSARCLDVLSEFDKMVGIGCPEVVLTGIHIGTYGIDLDPPTSLSGLIKTLVNRRNATRLRLSSIEPGEITPDIIGLLGEGLCRHLHIPLQSGDDKILAAMRRHYTSGFFMNLIEKISANSPGIALGTDIIVGFPGEGDREFQNTLRLVEQSPLTHFHVFTYSPRPGTPAAGMEGQVPEQIRRVRSEELRALGRKKNYEFRKRFLHAEMNIVVEDKLDRDGLLIGLTDNYIRVSISGLKDTEAGKEIQAKIIDVTPDVTLSAAC